MEIILEFLFELLIQIVGQILIEFGLHAMAEPFRKAPNAGIAVAGCVLGGALFGALSLAAFPSHALKLGALRWVNLALSPVLAGLGMSAIGVWRERRGQLVFRIDTFMYGYLFAIIVAGIRFIWAQ